MKITSIELFFFQVFVKNTPYGIHELHPQHYNKSTISSSHNNSFELPLDATKRERNVSILQTFVS